VQNGVVTYSVLASRASPRPCGTPQLDLAFFPKPRQPGMLSAIA